jgi:hypothetical protein
MNLSNRQRQTLLANLGALPFVATTLLMSMGIHTIPFVGSLFSAISVYALIIASFMAGSHWGQQLGFSGKWRFKLQVITNIQAVCLWLAYVWLGNSWFLLVLITSFLVSLWLDQQLKQAQLIEAAYWQTRLKVTIIVVLSLVIIGIVNTG